MTESLWNKYDISRKSTEVPVTPFARSGEEGEDTCTERSVEFHLLCINCWKNGKYNFSDKKI